MSWDQATCPECGETFKWTTEWHICKPKEKE